MRISIVIPVYNSHEYLRECVDSITNQTFRNVEVLLVDDGSTDDSGAICDKLAALDSRVIAIHKKNGGTSSARNEGSHAPQETTSLSVTMMTSCATANA